MHPRSSFSKGRAQTSEQLESSRLSAGMDLCKRCCENSLGGGGVVGVGSTRPRLWVSGDPQRQCLVWFAVGEGISYTPHPPSLLFSPLYRHPLITRYLSSLVFSIQIGVSKACIVFNSVCSTFYSLFPQWWSPRLLLSLPPGMMHCHQEWCTNVLFSVFLEINSLGYMWAGLFSGQPTYTTEK